MGRRFKGGIEENIEHLREQMSYGGQVERQNRQTRCLSYAQDTFFLYWRGKEKPSAFLDGKVRFYWVFLKYRLMPLETRLANRGRQ
jgi:hypothetical protein